MHTINKEQLDQLFTNVADYITLQQEQINNHFGYNPKSRYYQQLLTEKVNEFTRQQYLDHFQAQINSTTLALQQLKQQAATESANLNLIHQEVSMLIDMFALNAQIFVQFTGLQPATTEQKQTEKTFELTIQAPKTEAKITTEVKPELDTAKQETHSVPPISNPLIELLGDGSFGSITRKKHGKKVDNLTPKTLAHALNNVDSTVKKIAFLEDAFVKIKTGNKDKASYSYTRRNSRYCLFGFKRRDDIVLSCTQQKHIKYLKRAYLDVLKHALQETKDQTAIKQIAQQSELLNFNRTHYKALMKEQTRSYQTAMKMIDRFSP